MLEEYEVDEQTARAGAERFVNFAQATLSLEGAVVIKVVNYDVPIENIDHALLQVWSEEDLMATKDFLLRMTEQFIVTV